MAVVEWLLSFCKLKYKGKFHSKVFGMELFKEHLCGNLYYIWIENEEYWFIYNCIFVGLKSIEVKKGNRGRGKRLGSIYTGPQEQGARGQKD